MQVKTEDINSFENIYISTREKEKRILTDEELRKLPQVSKNNPYKSEWNIRARSAQRIRTYLDNKGRRLNILEVGCGNGWLSAYLSRNLNHKILAIDINSFEVRQAKRVFGIRPNLEFEHIGIHSPSLTKSSFDIILFAASIQYFRSLAETLNRSLELLNENGEIHITDSFFYDEDEVPCAKNRTAEYYQSLGSPEMNDYYFHHSYAGLEKLQYSKMPERKSILNTLTGKRIFPWIKISK